MMVRILCLGALALGLTACPQEKTSPPSGTKKPTGPGSAAAHKPIEVPAASAAFRAHFSDAQVLQFARTKGKWTARWQTPPKAGALVLATVCAKDLFFDGAVKPLAPVGLFHNPTLQRQELVFEVMSNSYETGRGEKRKAIIYVSKDGVLRCRHADNYAFKRQARSCLKMTCAPVKQGITPSSK